MVDVLSINRSIYKAKKYLNQNDFKVAKNQYLKILLKFPKNIRILNELKNLIIKFRLSGFVKNYIYLLIT